MRNHHHKQSAIDKQFVASLSTRAPICEACRAAGKTIRLTPTYRRLFGDRQEVESRFVCAECATKYAIVTRMKH